MGVRTEFDRKIIQLNQDSKAVTLSPQLLESLGWKKGDTVSMVAAEARDLRKLNGEFVKDDDKVLVVKLVEKK